MSENTQQPVQAVIGAAEPEAIVPIEDLHRWLAVQKLLNDLK